MNSWNAWNAAQALGEEADAQQGDGEAPLDATAAPSDEEPDYTFDGYSVEFLDKVALMPIVPKPPPAMQDPA